jgi:thermitase
LNIKRLHLYIALSFLLLCTVASSGQTAFSEGEYVQGEVLVRFHDGVTESRRNEIIKRMGAKSSRLLQRNIFKLRLPGTERVEQAISSLESNPDVLIAQPNYIYRALAIPNDTDFADQWNMTKIGMPAAWDITRGDAAVVIAVIDSGVTLAHPDLQSKLTAPSTWHDFVDGDNLPDDENGHGTHVAGIAAAATNNSLGVAGVAWQCRIMPLRILDEKGEGSTVSIISAVDLAVDQGADVINLSLGTKSSDSLLQAAVDRAYNAGVVVVAAAGNKLISKGETDEPFYPAAYPQVIAVAASDSANIVPVFSIRGDYVDVAAPGVSIKSTFLSGYNIMSGTSMAAPHVSGLAALMMSINPALTPAQIATALKTTATDIDAPGVDIASGYGLINASASLQAVPGVPLTVATSSLPAGREGMAYEQTLAAFGGTEPYTWSLLSGSLPLGLTLSAAGVISGTPTRAGSGSFIVRVRDALSKTADKQLSLIIDPPLIHEFPAGVSLISFPYQPSDSDTLRLLMLNTTAGEDAALWNPTSGSYIYYSEGSSLQSIQPGIGYWIKLTSPRNITATGHLIEEAYSMPLSPGWNQVGLPYNYILPWSSLLVKQGSVTKTVAAAASSGWVENYGWYYAGGRYNLVAPSGGSTTWLQPWLGYWVYSNISAELIFPSPTPTSFATAAATEVCPIILPRRRVLQRVDPSWSLEITATVPGQSDSVRLGVEGISGQLRILKPPALQDMLYLGIVGSHNGAGVFMDSDIRGGNTTNGRFPSRLSAFGISQRWEMMLYGIKAGGPVTLSWELSSLGKKPSELFLVDGDSGRRVNMLQESNYTITSVNGLRHLCIEAGTRASLEDNGRHGIIRDVSESDSSNVNDKTNEKQVRFLLPRQVLAGSISNRVKR